MSLDPDARMVFLPLGGAGEIGMNLNLYGLGPPGRERWIMVDLGVTFSDGYPPGIDVIMPDPTFIEAHLDRLEGLVLTHAHEDHLGAVPYLWDRLRCPVYATKFTATFLREKLKEVDWADRMSLTEVPLSGRFSVGPFDLELITLTHSIPEPNAIAIGTPLGTVLHTGDWKFDPNPVVGPTADEDALRRLGESGVLAMVCDSTNVFEEGTSGSEADLFDSLKALVGDCKGRIAVTCFASNVARLETIAAVAADCGRDVVAAGRSIRRIEKAARSCGYLADTPAFIDESYADYMPRDKALILCTGSQGEPRAALARIAAGTHPHIALCKGDTVIFSARIIPGNEISIGRLHNQLVRLGLHVLTQKDHFVHVSGHPARDELAHMYALVRPQVAVPVHGELRHLVAHAELARQCQTRHAIVAENGRMVRLAPDPPDIVEEVPSGRLYLEGKRLIPADSELVRSRVRGIYNGIMMISVAVDRSGRLVDDPQISTVGLLDRGEEDVEDDLIDAVIQAVEDAPPKVRRKDNALSDAVRIAARRAARDLLDKRPVTQVHLVRVEGGSE